MLVQHLQVSTANSDKNIQTDLIIMDFAKAFDKVPHQRLLYKLKFYGIKNQTLTHCIFHFFCMLVQHLHVSSQLVCSQSEVIFEK
jgi:hypothetical protein